LASCVVLGLDGGPVGGLGDLFEIFLGGVGLGALGLAAALGGRGGSLGGFGARVGARRFRRGVAALGDGLFLGRGDLRRRLGLRLFTVLVVVEVEVLQIGRILVGAVEQAAPIVGADADLELALHVLFEELSAGLVLGEGDLAAVEIADGSLGVVADAVLGIFHRADGLLDFEQLVADLLDLLLGDQ